MDHFRDPVCLDRIIFAAGSRKSVLFFEPAKGNKGSFPQEIPAQAFLGT
jgi:hypothetical protein